MRSGGEKLNLKYFIVANPVADHGRVAPKIEEAQKLLTSLGLDFEIKQTEGPWHAAELSSEAARSGYDVVVAMGGDGTANEVLNGIMMAKEKENCRCSMGILAVGRGNDMAFGMGILGGLNEGCRVLAEGHTTSTDVGLVFVDHNTRGRYFGNGIGIGFDAAVGFEAAKMTHLHGFPAYVCAALKTLMFYYNAPHITTVCDGKKIDGHFIMISIMNGNRMGGGFMMAPEAINRDGLLDICIVEKAARPALLRLMLKFIKGTHTFSHLVKTDRARHIEVISEMESLPAHADGETLCHEGSHLKIEVVPESIDIVCSKRG